LPAANDVEAFAFNDADLIRSPVCDIKVNILADHDRTEPHGSEATCLEDLLSDVAIALRSFSHIERAERLDCFRRNIERRYVRAISG